LYATAPAANQGPSFMGLFPASTFNPYSGDQFHTPLAGAMPPKRAPSYDPASKQPWAGAGYYGSGGGHGPAPGSEAFVPLPGVDGKEFGIRAREAWEKHAAEYGSNSEKYYAKENLPEYPYFPTWSRTSEIGGRPDIFPRPMANLKYVNRLANVIGANAFRHSDTFYPQYNHPSVVPLAQVNQARDSFGYPTSPKQQFVRRRIGLQIPEAKPSWSSQVPAAFPQPKDTNSWLEAHRYAPLNPVPTLVSPRFHPQAGRNIMINAGVDKGIHPLWGGIPQFVPMPTVEPAGAS